MRRTAYRRFVAGAATVAFTVSLAGCGNDDTSGSASEATTAEATSAAAIESSAATHGEDHGDDQLHLQDATIRAKAAADTPGGSDMTAIFGTVHNGSGEDVELVGFTTSLGDATYEIHEVVDGTMRQKEGGVMIPAGGSHEFKPGGDHLMIMDYAPEIAAGDTVELTLQQADGSEVVIPDVAVRTMGAGHEEYGEDGDLQGHQHGTGENADHAEQTGHSGH